MCDLIQWCVCPDGGTSASQACLCVWHLVLFWHLDGVFLVNNSHASKFCSATFNWWCALHHLILKFSALLALMSCMLWPLAFLPKYLNYYNTGGEGENWICIGVPIYLPSRVMWFCQNYNPGTPVILYLSIRTNVCATTSYLAPCVATTKMRTSH